MGTDRGFPVHHGCLGQEHSSRGGQHGASRAVAGAESAHHHPHRSEADCHQACGGAARVD